MDYHNMTAARPLGEEWYSNLLAVELGGWLGDVLIAERRSISTTNGGGCGASVVV